jgi:hypothetical protein
VDRNDLERAKRNIGAIPDKPKRSEDNRPFYVSFFETDGCLYEQIAVFADDANLATGVPLGCKFAKYDKSKSTTEFVDEFEHNGKIYKPVVDDSFLSGAVHLPTGVEDYQSTGTLVSRIKSFFNDYFETDRFFEEFLPFLLLFYWAYQKFPFIPYLNFVGRTSTGKTTAMDVFGSVSYKGIDVSGSITMSAIFRIATSWQGTLLLDEFENVGEESRAMLSFLKSGVSNRIILRTEGDKERQVKAYIAKCPKISTSETPVTDAGLQSRTLVVEMQPTKRRIPLYHLDDFKEEAQHLQNQLLLWRLHHYNKIDLKEIKYGYEELSAFDKRVQQVLTPIYYLSDEKGRKAIIEFAGIQQEETYKMRQESQAGTIFLILKTLWETTEVPSIVDITKDLNEHRLNSGYERKTTEKAVGNTLRKILNLQIEQVGHEKIRVVNRKTNEDKTKELNLYYGLEKETPPLVQGTQRPQDPQTTESINPDELPF